MRSEKKSLAQLRREIREQDAADCRARVNAAHTRRALEIGVKLFPTDAGLADCLRVEVEAWCGVHADPGATLVQASTHEAGHFLAAAKLGLAPARALVLHPSHGPKGYSGEVIARPLVPEADGTFTADDVEREAIYALAGLLAEWWIAGGDPYASPSEVLEACMCAARSADMRGTDRIATLDRVFTLAAQVVLTFRDQIEQTARVLKSKRAVYSHTHGVIKILKSIGSTGLTGLLPLTPEQDVALGEMMLVAPIDLARFTSELGR